MKRVFKPYHTEDLEAFKRSVLALSASTPHFLLLESNDYHLYPHSNFGFFVAIGSLAQLTGNGQSDFLSELQAFHNQHQDWMFGYLSYDLKNQIEQGLTSDNPDGLHCPISHFFIPKYLFRFDAGLLELGVTDEADRAGIDELLTAPMPTAEHPDASVELKPRLSKEEYIDKIEDVKGHIQRGDIYEMNFCMEFFAEGAGIRPDSVFQALNQLSKAPFGAYLRQEDLYLMCSSPERYLKKWHHKVISQPIKGTIKRGAGPAADAALKEQLRWDPKERSENVMIVDLVRNDLSRIARKGSVTVEELFGIYTFEQVHQMISTIVCEVDDDVPFTDIIRATYPMGSMTGAPKYRAMELIEALEVSRRGLYSGAVGYITPQGNFDFNVVIRSIIHNAAEKYTSVHVGSAITIGSDAGKEYDECILKGYAMRRALLDGGGL